MITYNIEMLRVIEEEAVWLNLEKVEFLRTERMVVIYAQRLVLILSTTRLVHF
jgi:hypothetical protein